MWKFEKESNIHFSLQWTLKCINTNVTKTNIVIVGIEEPETDGQTEKVVDRVMKFCSE